MTRAEVLNVSTVVNNSKTKNVFPQAVITWIKFKRELDKIVNETKSFVAELMKQYNIVMDNNGRVNLEKTKMEDWIRYEETFNSYLKEECLMEKLNKIDFEELNLIKDQNDFPLDVFNLILITIGEELS